VIGIVQTTDQLIAQLVAGGVRAVADERDVNPPCVLVSAPVVTFRFGRGAWDGDWRLFAIVGDTGRPAATAALDDLLEQVQAALRGALLTGTPTQYPGIDGAPPLPAYELTLTTHRKVTP